MSRKKKKTRTKFLWKKKLTEDGIVKRAQQQQQRI